MAKQTSLEDLGFADYREYLSSEAWQEKRRSWYASKQNRKPGFCMFCNQRKPLDLHHKSYARIGRERLTDLIALCRNCHDELHALADTKTQPRYGQRLKAAYKQMERASIRRGDFVYRTGNTVADVRRATGNPNWPKKRPKKKKRKKHKE